MRGESVLRSLLGSLAVAFQRSIFLRDFNNRRKFPGLIQSPTVTHQIDGHFDYGRGVNIGDGCNLIVPPKAELLLGDGCYIGRYVELGPSGSIRIGAQTSIQDRSILIGDVAIGRYCMLSLNVLMTSGTHYFQNAPHLLIRDQDFLVSKDPILSSRHSRTIRVEDDCWLGMNAVVMPGVTVGRGCVVGASAVVTHDIPPYSVAVGAPARVIKSRFDFTPPRSITWRDDRHIPYFYSGFLLSQSERERHGALGGHVADARFSVYLTPTNSIIWLRVRSLSPANSVNLTCGGVSHVLEAQWRDCDFPASDQGPTRFEATAPVVVSAAWLT